MNIRDPHSYEHYWTNSWNETWKNSSPGFEPMTSEYDFHISTIIIYHLDGLFGTNLMTCSQLAC